MASTSTGWRFRRIVSRTLVPSFSTSRLGAADRPPKIPCPEFRNPATPSATPLMPPSGASYTVSAVSAPAPPRYRPAPAPSLMWRRNR